MYFIQQGNKGPIKIGRSTVPEMRLSELHAVSPERLRLLATIDAPEKYIHRVFAKERKNGEWFDPSPRLVGFIQSLRGQDEGTLEIAESAAVKSPANRREVDVVADAIDAARLRIENEHLTSQLKWVESENIRLRAIARSHPATGNESFEYIGWDEISQRVQRSKGTVQALERDEDLPVYRVPHGKHCSVVMREKDYRIWIESRGNIK